uniref:Ice-binding protein C-terminal domain-containing protein n=1 Tax=Solibacter usitatus (strain Ellin6076) TaxID=234267 RepID=Q027P3_SOLUE
MIFSRSLAVTVGLLIGPSLTRAAILDPGSLANPNANGLSALVIIIDEAGVGSYRTTTTTGAPGPSGTLGFHIGPADGVPNALIYDLPVLPGGQLSVQNGWLELLDPGPLGPVVGDVIHFHGATICFYSDRDQGTSEFPPGFADVDVLPSPPPGDLVRMIPEVGPEGANGATYVAINDPGAPSVPTNATYIIISDVPEPGTLPLLGAGMMILIAGVRRKLSQRA